MPINGEHTKICGARTRSGKPCTQVAMPNSRCKMHGGLSPRGPSHPAFKHGRYSKVFSSQLLRRYEDYLSVSKNRENLEAMAVLQVMINDDVQKLQMNALLWEEARDAFARLQTALGEDFSPEQKAAINHLDQALNNSGQDAAARVELRKNLDLQTRIKERDTRERVLTKHMVSLEELLILIARMKDIISRYVPKDRRESFEKEFRKIMGTPELGFNSQPKLDFIHFDL
jgi:hypothetical protein